MNNYCVQMYLMGKGEWVDDHAWPTIVEAVNYYLNARCENPETEFRIIQVLEV